MTNELEIIVNILNTPIPKSSYLLNPCLWAAEAFISTVVFMEIRDKYRTYTKSKEKDRSEYKK